MNQSAELVQEWFSGARLRHGERLPPERVLAEKLGLSRASLRKGLALLEAEGLLARQVGRGTFVQGGPAGRDRGNREEAEASGELPDCSPRHLLSARLAFEPQLARLAAREATAGDLERISRAEAAVAGAQHGASFEDADDAFHRAIAQASGNPVLVDLFDRATLARRRLDWGRLGDRMGLAQVEAARGDHARILGAILARDAEAAEAALAHHLMVEAATILGLLV